MLYDVRDFASVQDAINTAKDGDRLYFPSLAGSTPGYYQAPVGGWTISKGLEIFGDGAGLNPTDDSGTTFRPDSTTPNTLGDSVFVITAPVSWVHLHDFKIRMPSSPSSTGSKHAIYCLTTTNNKATQIRLSGIFVVNHGGDGFHFEGANAGNAAIVDLSVQDCHASFCGGNGFYFKNNTGVYLLGGGAGANRKCGAYCDNSAGVRLVSAQFENNQAASSNVNYDAQLWIRACPAFTVMGVHFEDFDNYTCKTAATVENCFGGYLGDNIFFNPAGVSGSRGIFITNTSPGITVGPSVWDYVDKLVEINASDNCTNCMILPQAVHASDGSSAATIILPDQDGNGNFAFVPTTKTSKIGAALLLPRVTTTVRDNIPAGILQQGLVIYNSATFKLNFYDGSNWRVVTST